MGKQEAYLSASTRCILREPIQHIHTPVSTDRVFDGEEWRHKLPEACELLKSTDLAGPTPEHVTRDEGLTLIIDHDDASGAVRARIIYLKPAPLSERDQANLDDMNTRLIQGGRPPFILTAPENKPTQVDTAKLFHLCDAQKFAFHLIANALDSELHNAPDITPLRLALLGTAGSGKSEVTRAFLWYAFQHRATHRVLVVSYTWKAARLLGNVYNPGYSTSLAFGINAFGGKHATPGTSNNCRAIVIPRRSPTVPVPEKRFYSGMRCNW
jgi:hypothetical protein